MTTPYIHPLSDVQTNAIGHHTRIWQFVVVLPDAVIGEDCNICSHCFIENDVRIGDRVTIKSGVQVWDGVHIDDDVFVGPNVSFSNDRFPRSRVHPAAFEQTRIGAGASIGAGAVVLPGVTVGKAAFIGAGAVVTKSVPPFAIVTGNPARIVGYRSASRDQPAQVETAQFPQLPGRQDTAVKGVSLIRLKRATDIRGSLTAGEFEKSVPFAVNRYFLVFDVPSAETRGQHAHRQCHQFLVCVRGSVTVVADDGRRRQEFLLDRPDIGVHLPPRTWGIQYKYTPDAVLLVFASHYYDPEDYIRDYDEFLKIVSSQE